MRQNKDLVKKEDKLFLNKYYTRLYKIISEEIKTGKYKGLPKIGMEKTHYNIKSLQILSGISLLGVRLNDQKLINYAKEKMLLSAQHQRKDGYFFTDKYSLKKDYAKANVQFLGIEFMNSYELIKTEFSAPQKKIFKRMIKKSIEYGLKTMNPLKEINQLTSAALLMRQYSEEFGGFEKEYISLKKNILNQQLLDGSWYEKWEAPGVDILYLTLQLAYLSRLEDFDKDKKILTGLTKGLEFLKQIILNHEIDISMSKRWLPMTPMAKKFVVYALAKSNYNQFENYIDNVLNNPQDNDLYYCIRALEEKLNQKGKLKIKRGKGLITNNFEIINKNNLRLTIGKGPIRISGAQITSIYYKSKGWVLQQLPIGKHELPKKCTQIRVELQNGIILNSSLDQYALLNNSKMEVKGTLRVEDKKFIHTPFGHYDVSNATYDANFIQKYSFKPNKIICESQILFGNKVKVKAAYSQIPIMCGKINSNKPIKITNEKGIYGQVKLHKIFFLKNKSVSKGETYKQTFEIIY